MLPNIPSKDMKPRSNRWSMLGVRSSPFSPFSRSSFDSQSHQGLQWLARRCSGRSTLVTRRPPRRERLRPGTCRTSAPLSSSAESGRSSELQTGSLQLYRHPKCSFCFRVFCFLPALQRSPPAAHDVPLVVELGPPVNLDPNYPCRPHEGKNAGVELRTQNQLQQETKREG